MAGALASLLGDTATAVFFNEHWERRAWFGNAPHLASLLEVATFEESVALGRMGADAIRVFRDGQQIERSEYTMSDGRGSTVVRPERLVELFADGATLVLEAVHLRFPAVAAFCASLAEELGHATQANAYYTPAMGSAFRMHHDTHDVFVVQLAGTKTWELRNPIVELPLPTQRFDPTEMTPGPVVWQGALEPGDVLYLPRGWLHQAATHEGSSLHLTVGVLVRTWHDELLSAVKAAATTQVALRRSVDSCRRSEALAAVKGELEPAIVDARKRGQRRAGSNPPLPGRFADVRGPTITPATLLLRRPEVAMSLVAADGRVALELPEKTIRFTWRFSDAVSWIVSRAEAFTPDDVPGDLTESDCLLLLRRLVKDGAVTLA